MADKPKKYCDGIDCAFCSEKEPCIYKIANRLESELKREEQKCEELNEYSVGFARKCQNLELDVFYLKDKNCNLQRQLDQLKAENEKLKKNCNDVELENNKLKQRIIEIDRSYKNRQEELEQTLTDIKEIVEERNYLDYNECLDDILQKISEVE